MRRGEGGGREETRRGNYVGHTPFAVPTVHHFAEQAVLFEGVRVVVGADEQHVLHAVRLRQEEEDRGAWQRWKGEVRGGKREGVWQMEESER